MNRKLMVALALITTYTVFGELPNLFAEHHEQLALSSAEYTKN